MNNDRNMRCGVATQAGSLADSSLHGKGSLFGMIKTSRMARIAVTALLTLAGVAMFPMGEAWAQTVTLSKPNDTTIRLAYDNPATAGNPATTVGFIRTRLRFPSNLVTHATVGGGGGLIASVRTGNYIISPPPGVVLTLSHGADQRDLLFLINRNDLTAASNQLDFTIASRDELSETISIAHQETELFSEVLAAITAEVTVTVNGSPQTFSVVASPRASITGTDADIIAGGASDSFTIGVQNYGPTFEGAADFLAIGLSASVPGGTAHDFATTTSITADGGAQTLTGANVALVFGSATDSSVYFLNDGVNGFYVVLPEALFADTAGSDTTEGRENITITVAVVDGATLGDVAFAFVDGKANGVANTTGGTPSASVTNSDITDARTTGDVTYTIVADPTSVTVTSAETSVVEGGGAFDITVALDAAVRTGTVTLPYTFSGAGITTDDFSYTVDGTDTTGLTGTLVFAATEQSKVIAVTALDDSTTETAGETLKFKLTAGDGTGSYNGVVVGDDDEVDITISDNTSPTTVSVTPTGGTIPETGGSVVITVALDNPLRASDIPSGTTVDIAYTLNTGTATVTDDYTVQCGDDAASLWTCTSPFAFAAGDQSKIVRVTAVSDFADDGDETVILALADDDIALTDSNEIDVPNSAGATITITDDDVPPTAVSSVVADPSSIREDGGASTITVTLDSAAVTGGVSILYAFTGTAVSGTDFTAPASPLVIPAGMSSGTITVTVPTTAADDNEDDETIILTLMATTPVLTLPSPASATITITDLANAITLRWRDRDVDNEVPLGTTNPLDLSSPTADFARRSPDDGEGPFYLELPDNVAAGDVIEVQYEVRSADGTIEMRSLFITVPTP